MRLKRELKHLWYFIAALALLGISCIAYIVVLWCLPLTLLFLAFAKAEAALGGFTASTLMVVTYVLMAWVLKNNPGFISQFFAWITRILGAPSWYGSHLFDRINQENTTPNRDK